MDVVQSGGDLSSHDVIANIDVLVCLSVVYGLFLIASLVVRYLDQREIYLRRVAPEPLQSTVELGTELRWHPSTLRETLRSGLRRVDALRFKAPAGGSEVVTQSRSTQRLVSVATNLWMAELAEKHGLASAFLTKDKIFSRAKRVMVR